MLIRMFWASMMRYPSGVAALAMAIGVLGRSGAQVPPQGSPRPSFEVASIKEGDSRAGISVRASGRRFEWENIPVSEAIIAAYRIGSWQLSGAPEWMRTEPFTILALAPEGAAIREFPFKDDRLMMMLQSLLESRFKLQFHWQAKDAKVYALTVAKSGPRLKVSQGDNPEDPNQRTGMSYRRGLMKGTRASMGDLARALSATLECPVLDQTQIKGIYDFTVTYSRTEEDMDVSLFTALQEQVGLRLEAQKGQAQVFIVDHIERPGAN